MHRAALLLVLAAQVWPACLAGQTARATPPDEDAPRFQPRVVSLLPAATEILLSLGATDLLVARTESDGARALGGLPSVGPLLAPNLEVLASVEPSLVIAWAGADIAGLSRVVERRGGRVATVTLDRLADLLPAIEQIGGWVGRAGTAAALAAKTRGELAEVGRVASGAAPPRVLWVLSTEPIVVAGPRTFIADVIDLVGAANATDSLTASWLRLGNESLLALDPDVLVWPEGPGVFAARELVLRPGWQTLRAVRAGRVLVVDPERYHDPGPQIAAGALELARRLQEVAPR